MSIFKRKLWLAVFVGAGSIFAISLAGGKIAKDNAAALNKELGISTTVKGGDGPDYFPLEYGENDLDALKARMKAIGEEVENEGLVLLQNKNNALPLTEAKPKVSLLGSASYNFSYVSSGSSAAPTAGYPEFDASLTELGFDVNPAFRTFYKDGAGKGYGRAVDGVYYITNEAPFSAIPDDTKNSLTNYGDAVIFTLARSSGEGNDLPTSLSDCEKGDYLSLSEAELSVLQGLTALKNEGKIKKIIVLLDACNPVEVDFLHRDGIDVDATIWCGNVGAYGMPTIGKVLKGTVNPSGRLSDTYCRDNFSSPAMQSWALNRRKLFSQGYGNVASLGVKDDMLSTVQNYGVYNEGIYVGYRYYETRYADVITNRADVGEFNYDEVVGFPFGHGLSYSEFSYTNFTVSETATGYQISVKVKNESGMAGKHAVQVYLCKPYTAYDVNHGIEKSAVELVGFDKTEELALGGEATVTINVSQEALKAYDANEAKTYVLEDGDYYFAVGKDAHDANKNILAASAAFAEGDASLAGKVTISTFDAVKYSKSTQTGATITNQLDHADPNKYDGINNPNAVTYVSRKNWAGTMPSAKNSISIDTDKMRADLSSHRALPDNGEAKPSYGKATSLNAASLRDAEWTDDRWYELIDSMSFGEQAKLVTNGQMVTSTVKSIGLPESFSADGPTAVTETKTNTSFPSQGIWASTFNKNLINKLGEAFAIDARYANIQGMYAPGVNIHRSPFNGRANEYFSEDPYLTGTMAAAEIQGMQKHGVLAYVKHYAFNDQETNRNGIGTWLNEQSAREIYLLPFEIACSEGEGFGNARAVMSSFNRAGCTWTGADANLQINILMEEWGYHGFIITDAAVSNGGTYMVYDDGIMGGTSLFLATGDVDKLDAYAGNAAFCLRVREAAKRIVYNVARYSAAMNGVTGTIGEQTPWYQTLLTGMTIGFGIVGGGALLMSIASLVISKKEL